MFDEVVWKNGFVLGFTWGRREEGKKVRDAMLGEKRGGASANGGRGGGSGSGGEDDEIR